LFELQHFGNTKVFVLRMAQLRPQGAATIREPRIEFGERAKSSALGIKPDSSASVLHVLLDDAFLPTRGDVAEVRIKQVVRAHDSKTRIDDTAFAFVHLIDSSLHVVVDATAGNAAKRGK
jgi:hypothetical protein